MLTQFAHLAIGDRFHPLATYDEATCKYAVMREKDSLAPVVLVKISATEATNKERTYTTPIIGDTLVEAAR